MKHLCDTEIRQNQLGLGGAGKVEEILGFQVFERSAIRKRWVYSKKPTSVDNVALVQVVYGIKYLANGLRRILLSELAILANAVEQLAANS